MQNFMVLPVVSEMFSLPITIVRMKVYYAYTIKELKLRQLLILEIIQVQKLLRAVENLGIKIHWSHTIVDTKGYKKINSISVMKLSNDGMSVTGNKIDISCDCLGVAGGWTPAVHLFTQSGGKLKFNEENESIFTSINTLQNK